VLFIPGAKSRRQAAAPVRRRIRKEPAARISPIKLIWPTKGKVIATFGTHNGRKNDGIDIAAPLGAEVLAAESGKVIYADDKMQYYGNMIIIKHKTPYFTVYAHNQVNLVRVNEWVRQGQIIARVGQSGRAESPRLHFELRWGEKPIDPRRFLP